jgi:hypothetical protein
MCGIGLELVTLLEVLNSDSGTGGNGTPPFGVSVFASESIRDRPGPDHTPPEVDTRGEFSHGCWRFAAAARTVIFSGGMAVSVEMQQTGDLGLQAEVRAIIEHVLADRLGDWRVSILGSQANDRWEMKIVGPKAGARGVAAVPHEDSQRGT